MTDLSNNERNVAIYLRVWSRGRSGDLKTLRFRTTSRFAALRAVVEIARHPDNQWGHWELDDRDEPIRETLSYNERLDHEAKMIEYFASAA